MVRSLFFTGQRFLDKQSSSILSAATVITGASMLSALLGLLRNRLLVSRFFETALLREQLDAYWVAFRIPELVFQLLVVGAMSAAFIPVYNKYREKNEDEANHMAVSLMNLVVIVFLLLSLVIFIFADPFTRLITAAPFSESQITLAAQLTRVMLLAQLFFAMSNFMTGVIQANHRFLLPALSPLAYNLGIIIGTVALTPFFGIFGPALGVVLGAFLHLIIQWPLAHRLGFKVGPAFDWKHKGVQEVGKLMVPRALAISVDQFELMASVYFATALSAGSLTILNLAQQLMNAPLRVFSVPIGQASLPFLSKEAAKGDMHSFKETLTQALNQVLFLAFPASALLLVLRIPLVRLAYGAAGFPWSATLTTGRLVAIMVLAVFAYGGLHVLVRAYYALQDTKTPFLAALFSVIGSVGLMAWFVWGFGWGILGIGLALTVSNILETLALLILIIQRYHAIDGRRLLTSQWRIVLASVIMGVLLWIPMRLLDTWVFDTTRTVPLIALTAVVSLIGMSGYILLAKLFNVTELQSYEALLTKFTIRLGAQSATKEVIETTSQTEELKPW
jgi:putative peptidoglycan lipid II flippase